MTEISRTERLLAYLMLERMNDQSQEYKAIRLSKVGFSNVEVADLLGTTTASVAQTLYVARSRNKPSKRSTGRASTTVNRRSRRKG
jgi:hypothetical protein